MYSGFRLEYVPVEERKKKAKIQVLQLRKEGKCVDPVEITGQSIAQSFWGKSWCKNLENYSDANYRLERGRSYARHGSVVHLEINKGTIKALVSGSELYDVTIKIDPLDKSKWQQICQSCTSSVGSLIELLEGKLSKYVMERVCLPNEGLFPGAKDIKFSCNCFDFAGMCKHISAVMYGVGYRLDSSPDLLFSLRDVDAQELLDCSKNTSFASQQDANDQVVDDQDIDDIFGLNINVK